MISDRLEKLVEEMVDRGVRFDDAVREFEKRFISRVLGFVRDAIIARVFGAGLMTDAFFVAFKIPNLLRRLFAEGAFSQAFVPILGEYKNRRGEAA